MPLLTWNMQGATASGENVWFDLWRLIETMNLDVVCLQESGEVPQGTTEEEFSLSNGVTVFRWFRQRNPERARGKIKELYITQYPWDNKAHRVHMAVVTRRKPAKASIRLLPEHPSQTKPRRPLLGVNVRDAVNPRWYFTAHTPGNRRSGNPELDQVMLLRMVNTEYADQQWVVAGDYNKDPNDLQRAISSLSPKVAFSGINICPPDHFTQKSGNRLDYAVVPGPAGRTTVHDKCTGHVLKVGLDFANSDHAPVYYQDL